MYPGDRTLFPSWMEAANGNVISSDLLSHGWTLIPRKRRGAPAGNAIRTPGPWGSVEAVYHSDLMDGGSSRLFPVLPVPWAQITPWTPLLT
ncbi:MAG: hypothetical protein C4B57_02755 [Deltaproteobacteria bacterium]|nr:MAG: hypothetical protein C4B57_02755 [Deltaproteobacteria bacterium]